MRIFRRKFKKFKAKSKIKKSSGDKLIELVKQVIEPYFEELKKEGIKSRIESMFTNTNIDKLILSKVRKHLASSRVIELSKGLGRICIQYRSSGIQIEPIGLVRFLIKKITITDGQIIRITDDIFRQIHEKYVCNSDYLMKKIEEIISKLDETGIYKPETSEEKTIYDLVLLMLLNYYKMEKNVPNWMKQAIDNLSQTQIIEDWLDIIIDQVSSILSNISENLYLDFNVTFDSKILKLALNKKTNRGQLSELLAMMNINVKDIIYNIAQSYISPSFVKGMGELIGGIASNFLSDFNHKQNISVKEKFGDANNQISDVNPCQITITLGKNMNERSFRWYCSDRTNENFIEYSTDSNFINSKIVKADCEEVNKTKPIINFGLISSYAIEKACKCSVTLSNLESGRTYYYRVGDKDRINESEIYKFKTGENKENFSFTVLADSQGMIKYDYDLFLRVFKDAEERLSDSEFVVHMGDFVDDGNNEDYWDWLLDSKLWRENAVVPLAGNHEARISPIACRYGVENSIVGHFNVDKSLNQDFSTGIYYSYIYKNTLFIVLNTNDMDEYGRISKEQYLWALNKAKNTNTKWKILLTHKSPYSNGPHHKDSDVRSMKWQIIRLAYEGNIDLVIGGHDHVYVRTPMLSAEKVISCEKRLKNYNGENYETYLNSNGTIFIVPGTSGVKNYKQDLSFMFPTEKIMDVNFPIYSKVDVTEDTLYYTSYKYDVLKRKSYILDKFAIEKKQSDRIRLKGELAVKLISDLPDVPWMNHNTKIEKIRNIYNNLEYSERVRVKNYNKLLEIEHVNKSYKKIAQGDIISINSKRGFLDAVNNEKISTIVVDCDEIKFENIFGKRKRCVVKRDLCIRGRARLIMLNIEVRNNSTLIIEDSICIDNTRKILSLCKSISAIDVYDNSVIILGGKTSIRSAYGTGVKKYSINLLGEKNKAYLNSSSENWSANGFIYSNSEHSSVIVNEGKYKSKNKKFTFNISGKIEINGGEIGTLKCLSKSKSYIRAGKFGDEDKKIKLPSIDNMGEMEIISGKIDSGKKSAIYSHGEYSLLCLQPSHKGALRIDNEIIYLGCVDRIKNNNIKLNVDEETKEKCYNMVGAYSIDNTFNNLIDSIDTMKTILKPLGDRKTFNVQNNASKVLIGARYVNSSKRIKFSNQSKCYLFSKELEVY